MSTKGMAHSLIFDLDDTLFDSERAYRDSLEKIGVLPNSREFIEARRQVKEQLGNGHVAARNRLLYFKRVLENQDQFSAEETLKLMTDYENALVRHIQEQWRVLDRDKLFSKLVSKYELFLLSNENLRTQLIKVRAIDSKALYFSGLITSEEVGVEKPNPRIFQTLLDKVGVAPDACVMIGDNYQNDIKPAMELGMQAILTSEFVVPAEIPNGVTQVSTLTKLLDILQ